MGHRFQRLRTLPVRPVSPCLAPDHSCPPFPEWTSNSFSAFWNRISPFGSFSWLLKGLLLNPPVHGLSGPPGNTIAALTKGLFRGPPWVLFFWAGTAWPLVPTCLPFKFPRTSIFLIPCFSFFFLPPGVPPFRRNGSVYQFFFFFAVPPSRRHELSP